MSKNTKLDRRHDINAGEMLPQRLTRVEDMELYKDNIETVLNNEENPDWVEKMSRAKARREAELAEKKASIKAGDIVILLWQGFQLIRVEEVFESSVKVGPHKYGWECIRKPSEEFLKAVEAEFPGAV